MHKLAYHIDIILLEFTPLEFETSKIKHQRDKTKN